MLRKLIVFAITSGLASKAYRALMNRQRGAAAARGQNFANGSGTRPGQSGAGAGVRQPNR